jgi:hypothetical protein
MSKSFLARVGRTHVPTQVTAILLLLKLPPEVQKGAEQAAAKLQTEITTALDRIDNQMRAGLQKVGKAVEFKAARKEFRDAMVKWMGDLSHKAETHAAAVVGSKYSVHIELNEEGSSDYIAEIVLPKKIAEGLKMLPPGKLSELKKLLKEAFTKVALSREV